jgi:hypothetical protein
VCVSKFDEIFGAASLKEDLLTNPEGGGFVLFLFIDRGESVSGGGAVGVIPLE